MYQFKFYMHIYIVVTLLADSPPRHIANRTQCTRYY